MGDINGLNLLNINPETTGNFLGYLESNPGINTTITSTGPNGYLQSTETLQFTDVYDKINSIIEESVRASSKALFDSIIDSLETELRKVTSEIEVMAKEDSTFSVHRINLEGYKRGIHKALKIVDSLDLGSEEKVF